MKRKFVFIALTLVALSGCSSKPPVPPEPSGPLVKINSEQPHSVYGGKFK